MCNRETNDIPLMSLILMSMCTCVCTEQSFCSFLLILGMSDCERGNKKKMLVEYMPLGKPYHKL